MEEKNIGSDFDEFLKEEGILMYQTKYMEFVFLTNIGKTKIYEIISKNNDYILGYVKWYPQWRQYCFFPEGKTVFNNSCMQDICGFIDRLMVERKIDKD